MNIVEYTLAFFQRFYAFTLWLTQVERIQLCMAGTSNSIQVNNKAPIKFFN